MEEIKMSILIADKKYPVIVSSDEAELVGILEKDINENIKSLQSEYGNLSKQDCLAMLLFNARIEKIQSKNQTSTRSEEAALKEIDELLSIAVNA